MRSFYLINGSIFEIKRPDPCLIYLDGCVFYWFQAIRGMCSIVHAKPKASLIFQPSFKKSGLHLYPKLFQVMVEVLVKHVVPFNGIKFSEGM